MAKYAAALCDQLLDFVKQEYTGFNDTVAKLLVSGLVGTGLACISVPVPT